MAEVPQKATVQNIIRNIKESEIPQIQAAARDLSQRIKQLEEHSSRLESYVNEMENLAAAEAGQITGKSAGADSNTREGKPKVGRPRNADRKEIKEPKATGREAASEQFIRYSTPEGFTIRKVRR
jgi:hypothetical protein